MGLAYGMLVIMICGAALIAFLLLKSIQNMWKKPEKRILAGILLILAGCCMAVALSLIVLIWRNPPWSFFH